MRYSAVGGTLGSARETGGTRARAVSSRIVALKGLRDCRVPIVIDDFHYVSRELQGALVRALKPLVFDGLPVVLIAIPHRRFDALKVEREMTGRIHPVQVPAWSEDELSFIPKEGFRLLRCVLAPETAAKLSREAIGSPHLMQDFCRAACKNHGIETDADGKILEFPDKYFIEVAEAIGRPIFEKLARGPRQRTDRIPRRLKSGAETDIYGLVLHGLAHLKPGLDTLEYEQLRAAIRDVIATDLPQLHEVARVLKHMASIAATDESSTPVIDFEDADKKLHITDPFFAFYLRWGSLEA